MSDLRDTLSRVVNDRLRCTGDTVYDLARGDSFVAEVQEVADIELNTALGRDARESATMHLSDRDKAATLQMADFVLIPSMNSTFQIIRIEDNPVSLQVEFGLRRIVPGVDL